MLNNMKISTRLSLGFGAVSALLLVILIMGLQSLSSLKAGLEAANMTSQHAKITGDIRNALLNQDVLIRKTVGEFNEAKATEYLATLKQVNDDLAASITAYHKLDGTYLSDEEKKLFTDIETDSKQLDPLIKKIGEMVKGFQNAAAGTLADNEMGPLAVRMNAAMSSLTQLQNKNISETEAQSASTYSKARVALLVVSTLALVISAILGQWVTRSVTGPLKQAVSVAQQVASGDLTGKIVVSAQDETGQLLNALQHMKEQLSIAVSGVRKGSDEVKTMSAEVSSTANEMLNSANHQSEAAASTASALQEIAVSVACVADAAQELHELSDKSLEATNRGNDRLQTLLSDMTGVQSSVGEIEAVVLEFVKSTQAITSMTKQVRDIADQTNLLALNAAIEAARAGEHGRGFAVVADEVRKLAELSSLSAKKIDDVTQNLSNQSNAVSQVVARGKASLEASSAAVESVAGALEEARAVSEKTNHGVGDITSSVNEQKIAITEITKNMEAISRMADQNRANVDNAASKTREMERVAVQMESSVKIFKS